MITALEYGMQAFCSRPLGACRYEFMDARFEKVFECGQMVSKAVLVAEGVTQEARREELSRAYWELRAQNSKLKTRNWLAP